jgi:hypothetical protein
LIPLGKEGEEFCYGLSGFFLGVWKKKRVGQCVDGGDLRSTARVVLMMMVVRLDVCLGVFSSPLSEGELFLLLSVLG